MCAVATHSRAVQDLGSRGYAAIGNMKWVTVSSLVTANSCGVQLISASYIHPMLYEVDLGILSCSVAVLILQLLGSSSLSALAIPAQFRTPNGSQVQDKQTGYKLTVVPFST
ncbi:uncharacterized protein FFB20_14552 [Fusarium fujikuroi]|uniref:Uncharacterized protein n=1 Tax=Gibberella fujikuroi (strain CBS 195.34 / IMI 58289 / NRRL A-6831) TaxID=1279085 RepID=S0E4K8_GIBF5|nr:uncharacterized protein FFUJ_07418 [Fusarium fujikuroi IMI 58289]SCN78528.1 uncharacterized protein FFC1_02975 [Fusarium fujikuroi]CCT68617.1 uncharacterized protein FFUJ_07418 [Fusarium fujikuroi IMI 58289]SCN85636.1 uncharacterized protein FFE2_05737 [Fusarium fujikuroi]SCN91874.1 uncharacterized protein FFM5_05183 [Fusarium fujikuroi]SCO14588.1 uncharacterized protein FFB20_14552 [Fusarium fujikuroi]